MRKNFFKKLSFVLALAMIISVIAPAAGALAASAPKLNSVKKYLHLDKTDYNEFNFNISSKQTGWKYDWTSANEDVAVVDDANGVTTATGVGSTKISVVITNKDGEEQAELAATVVVRDNIISVAISNAPEGNKLAIGASFDFNRSYTTVSGSTTKTSAITRWFVEGATISDSGLFTATVAGKYSVVAKSFQSTEKYDLYKADPTANAGYLLATSAAVEVTVAPTMKEVKQVNSVKATVVFDADMSKELTKDNLKVYRIITGSTVSQDVPMLVKEVKFNAAGTEATVELFVSFVAGDNYKFVYGTMESGFAAAKTDATEVVAVELSTKDIVWSKGAQPLTAVLKNKNGVDITTSGLSSRVEFKLETTTPDGYINAGQLVMFKTGSVVAVRTIYHTYTYDSSYKEITIESVSNVVAIDDFTIGGATAEWTFKTADPTKDDWGKALTKTLAAGDTGYKVYARVKGTNSTTTEYYYSYSPAPSDVVFGSVSTKFTFASTNPDVLYVSPAGDVYPIKQGNAVIICYYDGKARDTFAVAVDAARKVVSVAIKDGKNSVTLSNSGSVADAATLTIVLKDQLGADFDKDGAASTLVYDNSKTKVETLKSSPQFKADGVTLAQNPLNFANDGINLSIVLTGAGATKGTWYYLVTAYDVSTLLTVIVNEPTDNSIVTYTLTVDKATYDTAVVKDGAVDTATVTLLGLASNGVPTFKANFANTAYTYTLKDPNGNNISTAALLDGSIEIAAPSTAIATPVKSVSGPAITAMTGTSIAKMAKGTYALTATETSTGKVVGYASFTVVDTTVAAAAELTSYETSASTVLQAVRNAFKVTLAGAEINDLDLYNVTYAQGTSLTTEDTTNDDTVVKGSLFVKSVKFMTSFTQSGSTYYVEYTVDINRSITIK